MMLAGAFFWPIWARAHAENEKSRGRLSRRFADEVLRLSLRGTMREDAFPDIVKRLGGGS